MIGQTLGHYRVLEKVAAGGMGVVYRARDEQLDRDVAVKVLPSGTLSDDTARRHFRKEAMALAKLNHPNIETVYEFGTQDGLDFLVMEYVPGKTLADRLNQPPVPPRTLNSRISTELETIILKCLDKDPNRRYQSATELLVDLRRLEPSSSRYMPPPPSPVWGRVAKLIGYGVAGLLALAVGLAATNVGGLRDRMLGYTRVPRIRSLAVLPFENLSGNPDQDYFAEGLTDALITDLGQLQALRVISRTSAMRYKSSQKHLDQIAQELHVDAIVEGSVSRSDGSARVTARLVYGPTDAQLWSRTYQRDLQNVFALQADLAGAIVHEIDVTLTPQEEARLAKPHSANFAAHDAYLKGRYHLHQGTEDQMREAKTYFEEAIRIDSNYAPAYAGLADYYWLTNELSPRVAMPRAKDYVQKALALDDGLADAHATLATIKFYGDWDWRGADGEYKRAIELNPSYAEAHRVYSGFLSEMGRHEQALAEIRTAQELEPYSAITTLSAGWAFYYARKYDRAIEQCRAVADLDPHSMSARDCVGSAQLASGANEQAIALYRTLAASSGNDPLRLASLGFAYALSGRKADARKVIGQLNDASKIHYVPASLLAEIHAALGDKDKAFSWLEKAYEQHDSFLVRLKVEPALDALRSDKRFEELLHRMSL